MKKKTHTNLSLNNSIISNRSPEENVITSDSPLIQALLIFLKGKIIILIFQSALNFV